MGLGGIGVEGCRVVCEFEGMSVCVEVDVCRCVGVYI